MQAKRLLKKIGYILISLLPFIAATSLQFVAMFLCMVIMGISMLLGFAYNFSVTDYFNSLMDTQFSTMVMVLYSLITTLLLGVWYHVASAPRRMPRRKVSQIFNPKIIVSLAVLVVALQYIISYLINVIAYLRPNWYQAYVDLLENAGMNEMTILLLFYSVIAGPICEEIIFRGVTLHYARKALPFWTANIVQAALFGLYHMNLMQGIYAFLVGIFCGYIYYYGKSIYLPILFHILFNLWGSSLSFLMYGGSNGIVHILIIIISLLTVAGGFLLYKNGVKSRDGYTS